MRFLTETISICKRSGPLDNAEKCRDSSEEIQIKILACCSGGINRSGGLKAALLTLGRLNNMGNDVVTIGLDSNLEETKTMLFEWADIVCVCGELELLSKVPIKYEAKTRHYDVGHDVYGSPNHWSLINQFRQVLETQPL